MFGDKDDILEITLEKKHIANSPIQIFSEATEKIDFCFGSHLIFILREDDGFWNLMIKLKNKGLDIRIVTEISSDNLQFCNKLINKANVKVFHKDDIKGNFAIVDENKYLCFIHDDFATDKINLTPMELQLSDEINTSANFTADIDYRFFYLKNTSFVQLQQYLFDNLCINSVSAEEKIREIKRGYKENFNELISDPEEILHTTINTINSATQEILLLIPTENSFYRLEYNGILNLLWNAYAERNVMVKILIYINHLEKNDAKDKIQKTIQQERLSIEVQYLSKPLENNLITIIMDQSISLAIEVSDDSQRTFEKAIQSAVYSNSEVTVFSCLSIFDTLWIQSELDKQNKVKHAYFQMFKGFNLKDEVYTRKWSFGQNKK